MQKSLKQKAGEAQSEDVKYLVWGRACGGGVSGMEEQAICDNECGDYDKAHFLYLNVRPGCVEFTIWVS